MPFVPIVGVLLIVVQIFQNTTNFNKFALKNCPEKLSLKNSHCPDRTKYHKPTNNNLLLKIYIIYFHYSFFVQICFRFRNRRTTSSRIDERLHYQHNSKNFRSRMRTSRMPVYRTTAMYTQEKFGTYNNLQVYIFNCYRYYYNQQHCTTLQSLNL